MLNVTQLWQSSHENAMHQEQADQTVIILYSFATFITKMFMTIWLTAINSCQHVVIHILENNMLEWKMGHCN